MVIFEILRRDISVIEYYKSFHWFFTYILENKCNGSLLNHLRCMFDNIYCDIIYYVIYVICSHYVSKAISPLFAWRSSYMYIAEFMQSLLSAGKKRLASQFNFTYRYIDDVLSINNPDFENYLGQMYPPELEIKDTTESKHFCFLLWFAPVNR